MLKIRLRPNKLLLAKQQIQIYGEEKAREEVKAWILKNLVKEEKIVFSKNACKMQDTMVDAVMVYSLHEPEISIENLTVPELTSQGIVYGVETPVKDVLSDKDVTIMTTRIGTKSAKRMTAILRMSIGIQRMILTMKNWSLTGLGMNILEMTKPTWAIRAM